MEEKPRKFLAALEHHPDLLKFYEKHKIKKDQLNERIEKVRETLQQEANELHSKFWTALEEKLVERGIITQEQHENDIKLVITKDNVLLEVVKD